MTPSIFPIERIVSLQKKILGQLFKKAFFGEGPGSKAAQTYAKNGLFQEFGPVKRKINPRR
jgi:hypothetical protein